MNLFRKRCVWHTRWMVMVMAQRSAMLRIDGIQTGNSCVFFVVATLCCTSS